ncbi:MAG: HAMP domain-containing histidine kinase [Planctomycetes bacterium]|nr:HAMP domain-containing histidine kinase [Planctomycetota bacterium]
MFGTKNTTRIDTGSGQLRWVILLLAIAVVLPTVCLLWFMTEAVENVRMAARQILIDEYSQRVGGLGKSIDKVWEERARAREGVGDANAIEHFASFVLNEPSAEGAVVYDESGGVAYPIIDSDRFVEPELPEDFERAWKLEFVEKDFKEASHIYMGLEKSIEDDYLRRKVQIGAARCCMKRGIAMATTFCEAAGYSEIKPGLSAASVSLAAKARVMSAEINRDRGLGAFPFSGLLRTANSYTPGTTSRYFLPMDSGTRMFVQERTIRFFEERPDPNAPAYLTKIAKTKKLLAAERLSAEAAQRYSEDASFEARTNDSVRRLDVSNNMYGSYHQAADKGFLLLWSGSTVRRDFGNFEKRFAGSGVLYRVTDDKGVYVSGSERPSSKAFLTLALGKSLPGWEVELFFRDSGVFEREANKQIAVYTWAGVLVIVLILAAGGFAGQAVGRQMKLNRLKNDFIATVSHELKTPLSSMRVLADTLLEGNYNDREQATEYLELICKENKRLSGLIDNFLTFSRMERNKQAFEMASTDPAQIARAAADTVRTKFSKGRCEFTVAINDELPNVYADKDAMVTVLANLLDNAYKYSNDDKEIALKVFAEDGSIVFSVCDNGIGMSRRVTKKIFKRFYQVDRSLSRRAEGCGLGLSIAKFIVDAHKGEISVESNPGEGSTFTVKLPGIS